MCDSESSSEFDNEVEDTEFGLYMQLYFEPNVENKASDLSSESADKKYDNNHMKCISNQSRGKETVTEPSDSVKCVSEDEKLEASIKEYNGCSSDNGKKCVTSCFNKNTIKCSQNVYSNDDNERCTADYTNVPYSLPENPDELDPQSQLRNVSRERLSSICSIDSISGSIPLDNLYCMDLIPDEEEEGINQILETHKGLDQEIADAQKETCNSRKRKRITYSFESDTEESRCASIVSKQSITKVNTWKKKIRKAECDSDKESDNNEDVYVLPSPSPQQVPVVTLASTSESDSEVDTTLKGKAIIKTKCKVNPQMEHTPKNMSRVKDLNSPRKFQNDDFTKSFALSKNIGKRVHLLYESDTESETESLEEDMETNLTMNIDKGLTRFLENDKEYKKRPAGKVESFDFSKTFPKSKKLPSCKKWTTSMASFYDSDISEDLQVEAVHQQQANSPRNWHINAEDYPVQHRYRYFNKETRCFRCRQFGHQESDCPRIPHCYLCSQTGHTVRYMCPENCCFRCGGEPHGFCHSTSAAVKCYLCGYHGHQMHLCPDIWRRYHITTSGLQAQSPGYLYVRPQKEQYCCICAKQGHYSYICPSKHKNSFYFQVPQTIFSYSSPVLLENGKLKVNAEAETSKEPSDVTKFSVKQRDAGRLIGRQGLVIKEVQKISNTQVVLTTKNGKCQVHISGSWEERMFAKGIIDVLLGYMPVGQYKECIKNIAIATNDSNIQDLLKYSNSTKNFPELEDCNQALLSYHHKISKSTSRILKSLPRSKENLLAKMVESVADLKSVDFDVKRRVKLLKKERDLLNLNDLSPDVIRRMQKLLNELSKVIIGREMYGNGRYIHERLSELQIQVKACTSNRIPEELCENIAHTLGMVCNPSIEKVDTILSYAEDYLEEGRKIRTNKHDSHVFSGDRKKGKKLQDRKIGLNLYKDKLKRGKGKNGNVKCKHKRLQLHCWSCKKENKDIHIRCRHDAVQSVCTLCKKQKEMKRKNKKCPHSNIGSKCKKCKRKIQHKRNSTAFWNEIFKET